MSSLSLRTSLLSAPPFLACLNVSTASYKDFRVCKNNLFRFLHYLKEHNLYSSLSSALRTSTCQTMPAFGPLACRRCRQHSVSSFQASLPNKTSTRMLMTRFRTSLPTNLFKTKSVRSLCRSHSLRNRSNLSRHSRCQFPKRPTTTSLARIITRTLTQLAYRSH